MDESRASPEVAHSFVRVHTALRRAIESIVRTAAQPIPDSDRAAFAEFCDRFAYFLETHHEGEEEVIFPRLTEAAAQAAVPAIATDVTRWRSDHEKLVARLHDFEAACTSFRGGGPQAPLAKAATEVRAILLPHLDTEEATLDAGMIAKLLDGKQAEELALAAAQHGQRVGGPKVLTLFVHELTDEEQRAQFSQVPWLVRKVLLKQIWSRSFRSSLKYAHNPSIAL